MTRDQIIETMARGIFCAAWGEYAWDQPGTTDLERDEARQQATAALSALEAARLAAVPGHAMASGHMEESAGKALYEHFAFYPNEQKPAWTPAGNAIRQDDARRLAMAAVNAWLAAAKGAHKP